MDQLLQLRTSPVFVVEAEKKAGLTLTVVTAEVSMPAKYLAAIVGLRPTCRENIPMGSFPKLTSIEKLKLVLGM